MTHYVLGFAFNDNHVLLIKKMRPSWQKGLYNGLGGHIKRGEDPVAAMVREFEEECGIATKESDWERFAVMIGDDWKCFCYRSMNVFDLADAKQTTDEKPEIVNVLVGIHNRPTVSNIPALLGLAMDVHKPTMTTLDYCTQ